MMRGRGSVAVAVVGELVFPCAMGPTYHTLVVRPWYRRPEVRAITVTREVKEQPRRTGRVVLRSATRNCHGTRYGILASSEFQYTLNPKPSYCINTNYYYMTICSHGHY
jgi:hypothetical protein